MQCNPVVWFEIYVQDMQRARSFYEHVFALQLQPMESPGIEMLAFPMAENAPGAMGSLVRMEGCSSGGGGTLVYFSCADCAIEAKRAQEKGGAIFREKFSIAPHGFIALVNDTEGNMIGLHSMQ